MNNFTVVLLGLIVLMLAVIVADGIIGERASPPRDPRTTPAIAERIRPPGQVQIVVAPPAPPTLPTPPPVDSVPLPTAPAAPPLPPDGNNIPAPDSATNLEKSKNVYIAACFACHETGAAGAPRRGDRAAWQPRIAQGINELFTHVLNGFKNMPNRGGNQNLTAEDIAAALPYLLLEVEEDNLIP